MVHFEKKNIQERFMQAPSFREYQPAKFVIKFVDFNKFRCASSYASSFKLFFFNIVAFMLCTVIRYDISMF